MERKIGEIFVSEGVKLKVVKSYNGKSCEGCFFLGNTRRCMIIGYPTERNMGICYEGGRKDKNNVIFQEVKNED